MICTRVFRNMKWVGRNGISIAYCSLWGVGIPYNRLSQVYEYYRVRSSELRRKNLCFSEENAAQIRTHSRSVASDANYGFGLCRSLPSSSRSWFSSVTFQFSPSVPPPRPFTQGLVSGTNSPVSVFALRIYARGKYASLYEIPWRHGEQIYIRIQPLMYK